MRLIVPLLVLAALAGGPVRASATPGYAVGDVAANLAAHDANGNLHSLADYSGRWIFLDFCARWCGPCRYMGASSQSLQDAFDANPGGPAFQYVTALMQGASYGVPSSQSDAAAWASQFSLGTVPVWHDDGASGHSIANWFAAAGFGFFPTGVLIDPDGVIRAIDVGYRTPEEIVLQVTGESQTNDPPDPPAPAPPAFLTSAGFQILLPGSGSDSPMSDQSIIGEQLQFFGFDPLPGLDHPAALITSHMSAGVETLDFYVLNVDYSTSTVSDMSRTTPWRVYAYSMTWSDALPRVRLSGAAQLSLYTFDGFDFVEHPMGVVVPDTFVADRIRFGAVQPSSVAGAPAHVVGFGIRGVRVAIDTTSQAYQAIAGVAPAGGGRSLEFRAPWPNPARDAAAFAWSQPREAPASLEVLDLSGRRVRALAPAASAAGPHRASWDLRDASGRRVAPGLYLVRLSVGGESRVRRIAVLE